MRCNELGQDAIELAPEITKTDEQSRAELVPGHYQVLLRYAHTDRPFIGD